MPGSKRKSTTKDIDPNYEQLCGKKRKREDNDENRDHNTNRNKADISAVSKEFLGVAGDKFTAAQRFKTDLSKISQSSDNKISIIFGKVDIDFVQKVKDEGDADLLEEIEDFPTVNASLSLEQIYQNESITKEQLGKGIRVTLEFDGSKVRRNIDCSKEEKVKVEDEEDEEAQIYLDLHNQLKEIEKKYNKTPSEIADIFVKVSGDVNSVRRYFEGDNVALWTYLEDLALTRPEGSLEYKCLEESKGKEEMKKRKAFLLRSQDPERDE